MNKKTVKSLLLLASSAAFAFGFGGIVPAASVQGAASGGYSAGDHGLLHDLEKKHTAANADPLHFTDIDFLSGTTGRAAGNGFVIGTSDGGSKWQEIYKGSWLFDEIVFPNNVKGYALAKASPNGRDYVIATADGGSTWKRVNTGNAVFRHLNVVGGTLFGYTFNGVYKSTDGGTTWKSIHVPANTRAAAFKDSQGKQGYALTVLPGGGSTVMKTTNGGISWSKVLSVPGVSSNGGELYTSGNQVWALLYGESGMSQVSYSLYASRNGGSSWNRVIAQDTAGGGPAPGKGSALAANGPASPGGHPGNMEIPSETAAYLAGGSPAGGVVGVGRSYNGGASWSNAPASIKGYDAQISFPSAKTGWLAVTSPTETAVYKTADGGVSWNQKFSIPSQLTE